MEANREFERTLRKNGEFITREQAFAFGFTRGQIRARLESGRWREPFPGVFATHGFPLAFNDRARAAMLYAGEGYALAGPSAAEYFEFWSATNCDLAPIHLIADRETNPGPSRARGLTFHRTRSLGPRDLATRHGVTATRPERTLTDLCAFGMKEDAIALFGDLERKGYLKSVRRFLDELRQGRDFSLIDQLLARNEQGRGPVGSPGEAIADHIFCNAGFVPIRQQPLGVPGHSYRVDLGFPRIRLGFEVDGFANHKERYYADRYRDLLAATRAWSIIRITWPQLFDPPALTKHITRAISARAAELRVSIGELRAA